MLIKVKTDIVFCSGQWTAVRVVITTNYCDQIYPKGQTSIGDAESADCYRVGTESDAGKVWAITPWVLAKGV